MPPLRDTVRGPLEPHRNALDAPMGRIVFLINPSCPPPDDHLKPPCPPPDDYRGQGGEGAPAGRRLHAA
eukprot:1179285-Prorocentrum_minimum.AAC.2